MSSPMGTLKKLFDQYQSEHLKPDDDTKHKLFSIILTAYVTSLFSILYQFSATKDFDQLKKELKNLPEFLDKDLKNGFMKQITEEINADIGSEERNDPDYQEFLGNFLKNYSETIEEIGKPLCESLSIAIKKTDERYPQTEGAKPHD